MEDKIKKQLEEDKKELLSGNMLLKEVHDKSNDRILRNLLIEKDEIIKKLKKQIEESFKQGYDAGIKYIRKSQ